MHLSAPRRAFFSDLEKTVNDAFTTVALPSGLTVHHCQRPGPATVARLDVLIGHLDDPPGQEGLAHLLEHLVAGPDEAHGSFRDRYLNRATGVLRWSTASTNFIRTAFRYEVPAGREAALLDFLARRVFHPPLADLGHHQQVLALERRKMESAAKGRRLAALFNGHRLATATGLPPDNVLFDLAETTVGEHHERWYRYGNAELTIVSPAPLEEIRDLAAAAFADPKRRGGERAVRTPVFLTAPDPAAHLDLSEDQARATVEVAAATTEEIAAWQEDLLRPALRTRLMDELRVKRRLEYRVAVQLMNPGPAVMLRLGATAAAEQVPTLKEVLTAALMDPAWLDEYFPAVQATALAEQACLDPPETSALVNAAADGFLYHGAFLTPSDRRQRTAEMTADQAAALLRSFTTHGLYLSVT